ncbi:MAG: tRNA (adenosine(37)-N6)-dimethylallyltransferase MiaA [Candidatus Moranbacteria bacterium]|nr:tRNA (adenosine(37)-N6)-dimethylallyltransferase MiaA [Candidatus Moranbacteria bacterium]
MKNFNKIIVILGPTSSGKSDAAIRLAKKFDGEVISADSRQIYRGMDVGTGKVVGIWNEDSKTFISEDVPHHLIDILSPKTSWSAAQFKRKTGKIIKDMLKRGKLPIICGGTGFWIKAVVDNAIFPEVKPDPKLREKLSEKSAAELFEELKKIDPERASSIDAKNKVRLIRAIEICKAIGKVPAINTGNEKSSYEFLQIGITHPKEVLDERIRIRLKQRFDNGMVEEVGKLHLEGGVSWKRLEEIGLGYYWITQYFKGRISKDEAFEKTYQSEKDYAKRQMTWFKKDRRILWLNDYADIEKEAKEFLG